MGAVERWLTKGETDKWEEIRQNDRDDPSKPGIVPWRGFVFFIGVPWLILLVIVLILIGLGWVE